MRYATKTFMVITAAALLVAGCDNYNKKPVSSQNPAENPNSPDDQTPPKTNQE